MWVAEWNEVVFTDESRICLQYHDGWIRILRHRGESMLNRPPHWSCTGYYGMGRYWYYSRTLLVRIAGTLNSQRYMSEVLEPVVLPYIKGLATGKGSKIDLQVMATEMGVEDVPDLKVVELREAILNSKYFDE
ncbi:transposable element Tcb1 transposase [Trichonephila clavipes]|nr:transposable element Tcb1 transposase [Trichonephila clavipes]